MRRVGVLFLGVAAAVAGPLAAGRATAAGLEASAWAITPEDAACHTDIELVSRSGAIAPIALISDGDHVALRFAKEGVPSQAFLPIRVDGRPFSNLVQRTGEEGLAVMNLSDETLGALRHGKTLQVAWLSDEAVSASLAGAGQGIADLKTCGAQVAGQHRAREAELDAQRARQLADARAKAVADEQLATARAQTAAAEAERQRLAAEAQRANAQAEELAAKAVQERAYAEQAQERAYADQARQQRAAQQYYYYNGQQIPPPPSEPPAWAYQQRPYYPR
ncbi:hypothetical protein [Phenylobacterium sp.]|uniref:hypothetical protein n=1 Tax=Phenylobacterium sp. TaxID=1871053 RepID=UPI002CB84559|nr:hypothetical protein [Phenylobacterium sp.]HLZ74529.1 hypothetical protein [Phenylobacterium sp.]